MQIKGCKIYVDLPVAGMQMQQQKNIHLSSYKCCFIEVAGRLSGGKWVDKYSTVSLSMVLKPSNRYSDLLLPLNNPFVH